MEGDFSRDSFDPIKNFTRVLMQQGRVQLDADWNEQVSIFWHHWRTFVKDLLGPYGGPQTNCGFGIITAGSDESKLNPKEKEAKALLSDSRVEFVIGPGNYYVDGILSVNPEFKLSSDQGDQSPFSAPGKYLIYIDVWERHKTHIEDPSIREVALNGADTCTRAEVSWWVRSWRIRPNDQVLSDANLGIVQLQQAWETVRKETVDSANRGRMKVHLRDGTRGEPFEPTTLSPDSRYRGSENHLYRVEIHRGGINKKATFKWSRENGAVVFPLKGPRQDLKVELSHLGRGRRFALQVGNWVELIDDDYARNNTPNTLWRIAEIDTAKMQITLASEDESSSRSTTTGRDLRKHPYLRRWDQKQSDARRGGSDFTQGTAIVTEGQPLPLENGIYIEFAKSNDAVYQAGDYWLIPARVTTGGIEWPLSDDDPDRRDYREMAPRCHHHYAPLAIVEFTNDGLKGPTDMRAKVPWYAGE